MTNHVLTGLTIVLSGVGLIISAAGRNRDSETKSTAEKDVKVPHRGVAVLRPTRGNKVRGTILLTQTKDGVRLRGQLRNLKPGKHGFHIHQYGDLRSRDGKSAGGHFAPKGHKHGGPKDAERHAGDLGNITAISTGIANVDILAKGLKLHFVIGRSIVVHGGADDLKSQPSGDAGPRVALGVIGFAGPPRKKTKSK